MVEACDPTASQHALCRAAQNSSALLAQACLLPTPRCHSPPSGSNCSVNCSCMPSLARASTAPWLQAGRQTSRQEGHAGAGRNSP